MLIPTVARSYLVVDYRYLKNKQLSLAERKAVNSLLMNRWVNRAMTMDIDSSEWLAARKMVPGAGPVETIDPTLVLSFRGDEICNIQTDAFRTAAKTLRARIKQFGADNREVKDWVQNQDIVFRNGKSSAMPSNLPSSANLIFRKDRSYQIASALFYSQKYSEAAAKFDEIAKDKNSQWHIVAPYLASRAVVRQSTLNEQSLDLDALANAKTRLEKYLADPGTKEYHKAAGELLVFVNGRTNPAKRMLELSKLLGNEITESNLDEYTRCYDRLTNQSRDYHEEKPNVVGLDAADELSIWIDAYKSETPEAAARALARWKKDKSTLWLMPLLVNLKSVPASDLPAVLEAGRKISAGSPAYPTAAYFMSRRLLEEKKFDQARRLIDTSLQNKIQPLGPSSENLFRVLRLPISQTLDEFAKFGVQQPAGSASDECFPYNLSVDYPDGKPVLKAVRNDHDKEFMPETCGLAERDLPLALLRDLSKSASLPERLTLELSRTVWVRAFLMKRESIALEMAAILAKIDKSNGAYFKLYLNAPVGDREFFGLLAILRDDVFDPRVTNMQLNGEHWWWCENPTEDGSQVSAGEPTLETRLLFLSKADLDAAVAERQTMSAVKSIVDLSSGVMFDRAANHPLDPYVPEMLHYFIRATRFNTPDDDGVQSKRAFLLLHQKYTNNPWTAKSPYWYK